MKTYMKDYVRYPYTNPELTLIGFVYNSGDREGYLINLQNTTKSALSSRMILRINDAKLRIVDDFERHQLAKFLSSVIREYDENSDEIFGEMDEYGLDINTGARYSRAHIMGKPEYGIIKITPALMVDEYTNEMNKGVVLEIQGKEKDITIYQSIIIPFKIFQYIIYILSSNTLNELLNEALLFAVFNEFNNQVVKIDKDTLMDLVRDQIDELRPKEIVPSPER